MLGQTVKIIALVFCCTGFLFEAETTYAASTKDAFIGVSKKDLKKHYKHLVMAPILVTPALGMPNAIRQQIEAELLKAFKKSGFEVLAPANVSSIEDQFISLLGKADTELNDSQRRSVHDHLYREVYYRYPVDGMISVRVMPVGAPFQKDKAEWDGVTQKIKHKGDGLLKVLSGKSYGGTIAASSIKVTITDRQGEPLYYWGGGIEVLMHRVGESLEYFDTSDLWQDPKRLKKAIKYAVKPL